MKLGEIMKRIILVVLLTVFIILVYRIIIGPKETVNSNNRNNIEIVDDKIKVGFSLGTLKEERWIKDRDILMAKIKELGADIIVQNANNDDKDQLKQVRYLLEQEIDVLIIVPNDNKKAAAAVELAKRQGVKVISYDRLVFDSNVDVYISFDNVAVGEIMAQWAINNMEGKNLLIINGAETDNNTKMIKEGYDKVLKEKLEDGSISLIAEEWSPNWMKEHAYRVTDELLQKKTRIDAIIAGNDGLAEGIIEALSERRLAGKTIVVGQDADLVACQRVVEGTQLMTVYKPIEKLADVTAKLAIQLARGERIEIYDTIFDGKYFVPYYILKPVPVDINNIESTIIKDGFHMRDKVFRNSNND